jgi:hypothetical protein
MLFRRHLAESQPACHGQQERPDHRAMHALPNVHSTYLNDAVHRIKVVPHTVSAFLTKIVATWAAAPDSIDDEFVFVSSGWKSESDSPIAIAVAAHGIGFRVPSVECPGEADCMRTQSKAGKLSL